MKNLAYLIIIQARHFLGTLSSHIDVGKCGTPFKSTARALRIPFKNAVRELGTPFQNAALGLGTPFKPAARALWAKRGGFVLFEVGTMHMVHGGMGGLAGGRGFVTGLHIVPNHRLN